MDALLLEIRAQIARYLTGGVDLPRFYDWLVTSTWEIERRAPEATADFARTAHLMIEESRTEEWPEAELKSHLRGLIRVVGEPGVVGVSSGSSSTTAIHSVPLAMNRPGFILELRRAGKSLETASA